MSVTGVSRAWATVKKMRSEIAQAKENEGKKKTSAKQKEHKSPELERLKKARMIGEYEAMMNMYVCFSKDAEHLRKNKRYRKELHTDFKIHKGKLTLCTLADLQLRYLLADRVLKSKAANYGSVALDAAIFRKTKSDILHFLSTATFKGTHDAYFQKAIVWLARMIPDPALYLSKTKKEVDDFDFVEAILMTKAFRNIYGQLSAKADLECYESRTGYEISYEKHKDNYEKWLQDTFTIAGLGKKYKYHLQMEIIHTQCKLCNGNEIEFNQYRRLKKK